MRNSVIANEGIQAEIVKLVGDDNRAEEMTLEDALKKADEAEADLIQVAVSNGMPICKLGNVDKYRYELKQKEKQKIKNSKQVQVKEIRFGPNISDKDLDVKLTAARRILNDGHILQLKLQMRGRGMARTKVHQKKLEAAADQLSDCVKTRGKTIVDGRTICITLKP